MPYLQHTGGPARYASNLSLCREDELTGADKLRVAVLGGQLMALREGLGESFVMLLL